MYVLVEVFDCCFSGLNSREMALYKSLFIHPQYSTIKKFEIRLTITNDITSTNGSSTLKLIRNTPPYNGSCEITPSIGVTMQTNFSVKCEHFTDDDHVEFEYKVTCKLFISRYLDGMSNPHY